MKAYNSNITGGEFIARHVISSRFYCFTSCVTNVASTCRSVDMLPTLILGQNLFHARWQGFSDVPPVRASA